MRVWIDQDLCTGDALCEEICPSVFVLAGGVSYVHPGDGTAIQPGGPASMVDVSPHLVDSVLDAAEACPGECIFVDA